MTNTRKMVKFRIKSRHLGVSKDTIRAWIKKNVIPYHRVGRQYKFRLSEVDAWVESGESAKIE